MYYDPYDEEVQVKFHRTDPTGRLVSLEDIDEARSDMIEAVGAVFAVIALAVIAWWLA